MSNKHEIIKEISGKIWEEALTKSFNENVKDAKIDGFRKGKCPRDIYEKKYKLLQTKKALKAFLFLFFFYRFRINFFSIFICIKDFSFKHTSAFLSYWMSDIFKFTISFFTTWHCNE